VSRVALTRSARFFGGIGKCLLTLLLLLVATGNLRARQQSSPASKNSAPATGQISGHVYSAANGAPLAKAVVTLTQVVDGDEQPARSVQTVSDGSFAFDALAPGKYGLSVTRCGFITQSLPEDGAYSDTSDAAVSLSAGQRRDGMEIKLLRGGVISGNVTDQDGEAVPDLLVQAMAFPYQPGGAQSSSPEPSSSARTDDLGNFRLGGLNPGAYYVIVSTERSERDASGQIVYRDIAYPNAYVAHDAQRVNVNVGSETPGIHTTVRLEKSFAVRGHIHGACQSDTDVRCLMFAWHTGAFVTQNHSNGGSNSEGDFQMNGVFPGEYAVRAIAFRQGEGWPGMFVGVGNTQVQVFDRDAETEVSVGPLAEVSGTVVNDRAQSNDVSKLQITLSETIGAEADESFRQIGEDPEIKSSPVDVHGHFQIKVIGTGAYVFGLSGHSPEAAEISPEPTTDAPPVNSNLMYLKEVQCSGRDYTARPLALSSGVRLSDCKVKIGHDTATINGKVLNGDKGVAGQIVVVIPESPELRRNPRYTMTGRTDRNGQFSIAGIIPGDYLVFAVTPNEERSYYALDFADRNQRDAERVTFKPGESKTFILRPSSAQ